MDSRDYPEAYLFEEGANITLERSERYARKLEAENARLREELAAAQKDAERYRWLKNTSHRNAAGFHPIGYCAKPGEDIDAAIDAAMKEQS